MTNWKKINPEFTDFLKEKWEMQKFDYEQAEKLIEIGLKPEEVYLAKWLRDKKGHNFDTISPEEINDLREEYQQKEVGPTLVKEVKGEILDEFKRDISEIVLGEGFLTVLLKGAIDAFFPTGGWSSTEEFVFFTTSNKLNYVMSIEKSRKGGKYWVHGPFSYQLTEEGEAKIVNRNEVKGAMLTVTTNESEFSFSTFEEAKNKAYKIKEEVESRENRNFKELLDIEAMRELMNELKEEKILNQELKKELEANLNQLQLWKQKHLNDLKEKNVRIAELEEKLQTQMEISPEKSPEKYQALQELPPKN